MKPLKAAKGMHKEVELPGIKPCWWMMGAKLQLSESDGLDSEVRRLTGPLHVYIGL